ncbi:NACHT and WD40 repeat domain-containing protein [Nocardia arthritidis]|uniref:NACHT N-terminal Helical domain-containing protein n=1 Tax=Nocardia arthritidis TaxID=228602 RepID=A0A6G9YNP8_9NOCA|nr:pentapeptide repeat-containing protein [Nocardia arthritidis]QIS14811.1 hypothetical protein F5544_34890 [Nocardia arthritidis]
MTNRQRLPKRAVLRHLKTLDDDLSTRQRERLHALADLIDENNRIRLSDALDVATPAGSSTSRQASFRKFRAALAEAAKENGLPFELVADTLKAQPEQRYCWFTGPDSVIAELAEISSIEARTAESGNAIEQSVAELLDPRDIRLYVSANPDPAAGELASIRAFIELLERNLRARTDIRVTITDTLATPIGAPVTDSVTRLADADVAIALLDPGYLCTDEFDAIRAARAQATKSILFVALDELPDNPDLRGLNVGEVLMKQQPFATRSKDGRRQFVRTVCETLISHLNQPFAERQPRRLSRGPVMDRLADYNRGIFARDGFIQDRIIESYGDITAFDASTDLIPNEPHRPTGAKCVAVERLVDWALDNDPAARRWCALLGDTGMGKTTTSRLLTAKLLDLRDLGAADADGRPYPLPIYFDLRDLPVREVGPNPSLYRIVDALLTRIGTNDTRPSADEVLSTMEHGNCVVVFDGLDEALVHLSPADGQAFTRTLWRAIEKTAPRLPYRLPATTPSKLLLSCRTHYFRSIRHEITHFTGQHRGGPQAHDYLSLLMLPFDDEQIGAYLGKHVPGADIAALLEMISSVHNLREMAERPFLLQLISEELAFVERAAYDGQTIRPVDLYGAFARRWLERDDGKHTLLPAHKLLLMEHLAAEELRLRRTGWSADDIEQWLVEFIKERRELAVHYGDETSIWKEDLRTATFLVRRGDDRFGFAHTSLREYFVAQYLLRALLLGPDAIDAVATAWAMPVLPSDETLDFLGQSLAGLSEDDRMRCVATLRAIRDRYWPAASELVFAYALRAEHKGFPRHSVVGTVLDGAELDGWRIGSADSRRLDLRSLSARSARLTGTIFTNVDLGAASFQLSDLTNVEFIDANLKNAQLDGADLTGAVFRMCDLSGSSNGDARTYRTQILRSELGSAVNWHGSSLFIAQCTAARVALAPIEKPLGARLIRYSGHSGEPWSAAYRPDGCHIITVGADTTAQIWDARTGKQLTTLTGHTDWVNSGCYSPDGNQILTTSGDGTARIWNARTGKHLTTLTGHTDWVNSGTYSPDGVHILTTSDDRTARIWDAHTGEHLTTLTGHTDPVTSGCYSPDSNQILTTSGDGTARIWNAHTGKHLTTLTEHTRGILSGTYSPDGNQLLTTSEDGTARIWNAHTGKHLTTLTGHTDWIRSGTYSPDGNHILTTSDDRTARIWNAHTGEHLTTLTEHTGEILSGTYSPDGNQLLTTSEDGTARIWNAHTGKHLTTLTIIDATAQSGYYSPDGKQILTAGGDGTARIWNAHNGKHLTTLTGHTDWVNSGCYSPDGNQILTTSGDGTARIWNAHNGKHLTTLTGHTSWVNSGCYSPDGNQILTTSGDGTARIWNAHTGKHLTTLTSKTNGVLLGAYSSDGTRILTTSTKGTIRLWDAHTGEHLTTLTGHTDPVTSGCYSPDGNQILITSGDGTARIWNAHTGEHLTTLTGHTGGILSGTYRPDGNQLLTTSTDCTARIWNAHTGEHLTTLTGHTGEILSGTYSPDGNQLLTTSDDRTARIWNAHTGKHLTTLTGHTDWIRSGTYSPDGNHILTKGNDGTTRIWVAATGTEILRICALPDANCAVFQQDRLIQATPGAWRYLGWSVIIDGKADRLPAETFGPLPLTLPE